MSTASTNSNPNVITNDTRIEVQPIPFKPFATVMEIGSDELAHQITSIFKPIFHDLIGTRIMYLGKHPFSGLDMFKTTMFFEYNNADIPNGKIRNVENLSAPISRGSSIYERNSRIQNMMNNKVYTLTDETKILLSDFLYGGRDANKPGAKNWNNSNNVSQKTYGSNSPFINNYNAERIILEVNNIDLNATVAKLFGNTMITHSAITSDNKVKSYTANAKYYVKCMRYKENTNQKICILHIEQYDNDKVEESTIKKNPYAVQSGFECY